MPGSSWPPAGGRWAQMKIVRRRIAADGRADAPFQVLRSRSGSSRIWTRSKRGRRKAPQLDAGWDALSLELVAERGRQFADGVILPCRGDQDDVGHAAILEDRFCTAPPARLTADRAG